MEELKAANIYIIGLIFSQDVPKVLCDLNHATYSISLDFFLVLVQ